MNELDLKKETLPDTPEDLAKFVLVGREKRYYSGDVANVMAAQMWR